MIPDTEDSVDRSSDAVKSTTLGIDSADSRTRERTRRPLSCTGERARVRVLVDVDVEYEESSRRRRCALRETRRTRAGESRGCISGKRCNAVPLHISGGSHWLQTSPVTQGSGF